MSDKVIMVHAFPDVNEHSAFIMDVVVIFNSELDVLLRALTSFQYFKDRNIVIRENKHFLKVITIEVVPGKTYEPLHIPIPNANKLINCIIFCQFSKVPANVVITRKVIIGNLKVAKIHLDSNGVSLMEEESVQDL